MLFKNLVSLYTQECPLLAIDSEERFVLASLFNFAYFATPLNEGHSVVFDPCASTDVNGDRVDHTKHTWFATAITNSLLSDVRDGEFIHQIGMNVHGNNAGLFLPIRVEIFIAPDDSAYLHAYTTPKGVLLTMTKFNQLARIQAVCDSLALFDSR